jgi:hypothetical protein
VHSSIAVDPVDMGSSASTCVGNSSIVVPESKLSTGTVKALGLCDGDSVRERRSSSAIVISAGVFGLKCRDELHCLKLEGALAVGGADCVTWPCRGKRLSDGTADFATREAFLARSSAALSRASLLGAVEMCGRGCVVELRAGG